MGVPEDLLGERRDPPHPEETVRLVCSELSFSPSARQRSLREIEHGRQLTQRDVEAPGKSIERGARQACSYSVSKGVEILRSSEHTVATQRFLHASRPDHWVPPGIDYTASWRPRPGISCTVARCQRNFVAWTEHGT